MAQEHSAWTEHGFSILRGLQDLAGFSHSSPALVTAPAHLGRVLGDLQSFLTTNIFKNTYLISLGPGSLQFIHLKVVKAFKMEEAWCTQESVNVCILSTLQESISATQTRNCCCNCSGL